MGYVGKFLEWLISVACYSREICCPKQRSSQFMSISYRINFNQKTAALACKHKHLTGMFWGGTIRFPLELWPIPWLQISERSTSIFSSSWPNISPSKSGWWNMIETMKYDSKSHRMGLCGVWCSGNSAQKKTCWWAFWEDQAIPNLQIYWGHPKWWFK